MYRKKMAATLLAAILMAIVVVMLALADQEVTVPMTVTVKEIEVVSISVLPESISFPDVTQGEATEALEPVVITNEGNVPVTITASVSGTDKTFYDAYFYTSPDVSPRTWIIITGWSPAAHVIPVSGSEIVRLQIDMGVDVPEFGIYSATLVFWAEAS